MDQNAATPKSTPEPQPDHRLYVPPDGWEAHVKRGWEKEYCYAQNPGEDFFHPILSGEIFLQRDNEKFCLNCALRNGLITADRLYWQHPGRRPANQR